MMPYDQMPEWLRAIAHINPLSYAIDGIRLVADGSIPFVQIGVLFALFIAVLTISVHVFRKTGL
jgi:ABC-2 type transport system permease protein